MTERLDDNHVANFKGVSGKTTTAVHIAAYMQTLAPAVLADGVIVRASMKWAKRGPGLPFKTVSIGQLDKEKRDAESRGTRYEHTVVNTEANPLDEDFRDAAEGGDLVVVPAEPGLTATDGLNPTLEQLLKINYLKYKILLTKISPKPQAEGEQLYSDLVAKGYPVFQTMIPFLVAYRKASYEGLTARGVRSDPNARRAWLAYERVGREILHD
jgi:chromosome partitioning protein